MDDTQVLDCTQILTDESEEEENQEEVAWLEVDGNRYDVFHGRNVIGRDPAECSITIPSKVLSKQHAVVEVRSGTHTIADLGSANKTRLGKMVLQPQVQYALQGGEMIRLGNIVAIYIIRPKISAEDSGSETGSESMLPICQDEEDRSSSPVFGSKEDHHSGNIPETPGEASKALQNTTQDIFVPETPSNSEDNDRTPKARQWHPSPALGSSLPNVTDSLLQGSDAESSVISATQSPSRRQTFTPPHLVAQPLPPLSSEDYNSDASTDVEEETLALTLPSAAVLDTPTQTLPSADVLDTPTQPLPTAALPDTPKQLLPSAAVLDTPTQSLPSADVLDTPTQPLPTAALPDTPTQLLLSAAVLDTPTRPLPTAAVPEGTKTIEKASFSENIGKGSDNKDLENSTFEGTGCHHKAANGSGDRSLPLSELAHSWKASIHGNEDLIFKKPFPSSTPNKLRGANTITTSPHPSGHTTSPGAPEFTDSPVHPHASPHFSSPEHQENIFDALTQPFCSDAPSEVDLDAPTQVFCDDAPGDVDLDAATQVFSNDPSGGVDLDAPTQVFSNDPPGDDAPTQVFSDDAAGGVDLDAPTQVFSNDPPGDDAPTQVFSDDAPGGVDLDAPTQVFSNDPPGDDAPTQVFSDDAPGGVNLDAPTQVFSNDPSGGVDLNTPTQVFSNDPPGDDNMESPTQVFCDDAPDGVNLEVQVFSDSPTNCDPEAPTQVFSNDDPSDWDAPTQVFDAPTQVFSNNTPDSSTDNNHCQLLPSSALGAHNCENPIQLSPPFKVDDKDDPPDSPSLLHDPDDDADKTQPFSAACPETLGPTHSIMEVWGQLDSVASVDPNTVSMPLPRDGEVTLGRGECQRYLQGNEAASDVSDTLLRDENEVGSHLGKGEKAGLSEAKDEVRGQDEEENCHSDESTYQKTLTDHQSHSSHKDAEGETSSSQSKDVFQKNIKSRDLAVKKMSPHELSHAGEKNNTDTKSITPLASPQPSRVEEIHTSTRRQWSPYPHRTRARVRQCKSAVKKLPFTQTPKSLISQDILPLDVSLPKSVDHINDQDSYNKTTPRAKIIRDSESEDEDENSCNHSIVLFDMPPNTEGGFAGHDNQTTLSTTTATATSSATNIVANTLMTAVSFSTPQGEASSSGCTPITPSRSTHASAPTSTPTLTHTTTICTPIPSRGQRRRKTDSSCVPTFTSVPSRQRRSTRTMCRFDTSIAIGTTASTSTTTKHITATTTTDTTLSTSTDTSVTVTMSAPVTATSSTTTTTTTTTTSPKSEGEQKNTKGRSQARRVTGQSRVSAIGQDPEELSASIVSVLPTTSAASKPSTSATNRRKRGRKASDVPVVKVKVEVTEEEVEVNNLIVIKQERKSDDEEESFTIKVEPSDSPARVSGRRGRTRRMPNRYLPDGKAKALRNRKSLQEESSETAEDAPLKVRRSRRLPTQMRHQGQEMGGMSYGNTDREPVEATVKTEPDSEQEIEREVPCPPRRSRERLTTAQLELNQPTRNKRTSRASARVDRRSASEQSSSAKRVKIKMENISEEENVGDSLEVTQSIKTRTRKRKISDCIEPSLTKKVSQNSTSKRESCAMQCSKRSSSEVSDSSSSVNNSSFSSRATRSNKDVELWSPSKKRQREASIKPRVLFTGYEDPIDLKIVKDLGGTVVETPMDCTVLVTTRVMRTCKFLSALGRGRPIVNPNWLTMSKAAGNFVDPWLFLVKDHEAEEKFGFCLEDTIKSASTVLLFEGLSIHATPSVYPRPCQMRDIIECSGGDYLHLPPKKYAPHIRIVSCPEDKQLWSSFSSLGIPILGVEFVLTGLLRHELLLDEFVLA